MNEPLKICEYCGKMYTQNPHVEDEMYCSAGCHTKAVIKELYPEDKEYATRN